MDLGTARVKTLVFIEWLKLHLQGREVCAEDAGIYYILHLIQNQKLA